MVLQLDAYRTANLFIFASDTIGVAIYSEWALEFFVWIRRGLNTAQQTVQQTAWLRWGVVGVVVGGSLLVSALAGLLAVRHLLGVAESPNCRLTLQTDNLAARLYCADEVASNRTVGDLRDAIKLVNSIPSDSPLRGTGDRRIERWSRDLLEMGEEAYQRGELEAAINAARVIPLSTQMFALAGDRIKQWETNWQKAEEIYNRAQDEIDQQNWPASLNTARELLKLGNRYWETTRYQQLMDQLQTAKEEQKSQQTASRKQSRSGFSSSFEVEAPARLRKAKDLARSGNGKDLKAAIAEAQQIFYGTPVYEEAQQLIDKWEQQIGLIEDRQHLDWAMQLAKRGTEASLQAAIDEAYQVSPSRRLYNEARSRIDQWMDQLYRIRYSAPADPQPAERKGDRPPLPAPNPAEVLPQP